MNKTTISSLIGVALVAGTTFSAGIANAATLACSATVASKVTVTTGCEYSTTADQDFLNTNPMTVNAEGFFGITNWVFGGKIGENAGYNGSGSGQSGTWDISSVVQESWNNVMLIFKSGKGTTLTGYKVDVPSVLSGEWDSPFLVAGKDPKDVSHISVYYTEGDSVSTPEPAALLGLAVVGTGLALQRRRNASVKA